MKNTQPGMDGDTLPEDNFDNNLGKKYDEITSQYAGGARLDITDRCASDHTSL